MDNVETGDEDVRKNLGAIPSAKGVNPHPQHFGDGGAEKSRDHKVFRQLSTCQHLCLLYCLYMYILL